MKGGEKNMLTKIGAVSVALVMVLSMNSAVSARGSHFVMPSNDVKVVNTHAQVINVAGSVSNTGLNAQSGSWASRQVLSTGLVSTVSSSALADVNTTELPVCSRCSQGDVSVRNEHAQVANVSVSLGNSGLNRQTGSSLSGQTMGSGTVAGVTSQAQTSVNYTGFSVSAN